MKLTKKEYREAIDAALETGAKHERERIITLMAAWDGNERILDSRGNYNPDALRVFFTL